MSNPRTKWMQEVIENSLNCNLSQITECFDCHSDLISIWLKSGLNESRIYFYETDGDKKGSKSIECSDSSPTLNGNCVYFLRNTSKQINLKSRSDNNLLTGNISKTSLIPVLESVISDVYSPIISITNEWDKIDNDNKEKMKFIKKGKQFSELLTTSIHNLDNGIILQFPDRANLKNIDPNDNFDALIEDTQSMNAIRECVVKWIQNIYQFICDDRSYILHRSDEINSGPKEEINFWCKRNLVLTKTYQLLNKLRYRGIIAVLQQDAEEEAERNGTSLLSDITINTEQQDEIEDDNNNDNMDIDNNNISSPSPSKQRRSLSSPTKRTTTSRRMRSRGGNSTTNGNKLRQNNNKWHINPLQEYNMNTSIGIYNGYKKINQYLNESLNEAEDNEKFLEKLRIFISPLYNTENKISIICDGLSLLFNNLKMIFTLSRYYSLKPRMSNLLTRITHQMVIKCIECIENGDDCLWNQDIEILIDSMKECIKLKDFYRTEYHLTASKLEEIPKGKQWTFDESIIFIKFEKFTRRLEKLIDLFSSIQQFKLLESQHIDGLFVIIINFNKLINEFRKKQHNLLNDGDTGFERDYVEFTMNNSMLENKIEIFIENKFKIKGEESDGAEESDGDLINVSNIISCLELLNKFKLILHREALQNILDIKYILLFKSYGRSLEIIGKEFVNSRLNPSIGRNMTSVAGNIAWSRQLLRRITIPMDKFRENPKVFHPKESHRIIKKYNYLTKKLIHYEMEYYMAWTKCCNIGKKKLQTSLIIQHSKSGEFYANFDRHIFELIRETKFLKRMGFKIPSSAKIVLILEDNFKKYFVGIKNITEMYNHMIKCTSPIVKKIIFPHFVALKFIMEPGLNQLTWNSMNIQSYINKSYKAIQRLWTLIIHINDILENRIRSNFRFIANLSLLNLPCCKSFTCKSFIIQQEKSILTASKLLLEKNVEIYNAIKDLIAEVSNFEIPSQFESKIDAVSQIEFNRVIYYYQTMMYHSILSCIKTSLNKLKDRASSRSSKLFLLDTALFEVNLSLIVPRVEIKPSLNDIQDAINHIAKKVIHTTQDINDWGVDENGISRENIPFFSKLSSDKNVVVVLLLLTGAVEDTKQFVVSHLEKYKKFEWLWLKEPEDEYREFIKQERILQDFIDELQKVATVEIEIDKLNNIESLSCFNLSRKNLKYQLKHECQRWKLQFCEKLHDEVKQDLESRIEMIKNYTTRLNREVKDFTSLKFVIDALTDIRDTQSWISMDFLSIYSRYELLEKYLGSQFLSNIETDNKARLKVLWKRLLINAEQVRDKVNELQEPFRKSLLKNIKIFSKDVNEFHVSYKDEGPFSCQLSKPSEAMLKLNKFEREFDTLFRKYELYSSGETLFGLKKTKYDTIHTIRDELILLRQLYNVYGSVIDTMDEYRNISWTQVMSSIDKMRSAAELYESKCKKLNRKIKKWDQYKALNGTISDFLEILPLIEAMSKPSMRARHWEEISIITERKYDYTNFDELLLSDILDSNILQFIEDIEEICDGADKQLRIENEINKIREDWDLEIFEFASFKNRGEVILKGVIVNDIIEKLEESMSNLNQMLTMKHVKPFRSEAESLLSTLSDVNDILERWIKLQQLWMSLESVFTSGDIARQMPSDTRTFLKVDKEWCSRFMSKAKELNGVIACCNNEYMKNILPSMMIDLERCQKALDGYLEAKRNRFPRFYFVSNPALLLILSQGSDKIAVQSCFAKVFDSITRVKFDDKSNIISFLSLSAGYEGVTDEENLKLNKPVSTNGNIEDWLGSLEKEMRRTMHREIKQCASDTLIDKLDFSTIIDKHCAQCSLLAIQFLWTSAVEDALNASFNGDREAIRIVQQQQTEVLVLLASMTTEEIKQKMKRRNIETLVTIQVHQKDVLDSIVEKYKKQEIIGGIDDFEWQKQLRCYWCDEERLCRIQIADVSFVYCWEYLGCKERLVVTPLTDRCYITLTQACGMFFGGAPAGPAGTGKTETVKDLGRALGKYVVVFNCSDQMRYTDTAKIYKGLCQSGSWGCFDEFNRIDLEVLSVVAQQIMAILSAMRSRSKEFYFPGDLTNRVQLDARCGFFITMNPGYAGRQELPENLKALFRSVAMMVPDSGIIIKVKLASVGYLSFDILSKKFNVLYGLCKEQLSKQRHYDFGLRNILSVLRTAGANLRIELKKGSGSGSRPRLEEMLMMRTLRDMNLSKLVGDDVGLFNSLLRDLFPNQPDPEKAKYEDIECALNTIILKNKLICHESWIAKIIQLYETSLVRHGLMMIGPAGGGKTRAIWCLLESLQLVKKKKYVEIRMNPKALKADEMFGENDTVSGEWTDGVFSSIWSKYNDNTKNQCTWIVCDGPVDAIWIENLNTVLDDNKLLTLANGDRIPMTDNVKILFEAEDLRNASPATVSRAGIIFVSETDLGNEPLVESWLQQRREKEKKILKVLWNKFIIQSDIFEWLKKNVNAVFASTPKHLSVNLLSLLSALLKYSVNQQIFYQEIVYEKLFIYCMAWSVGGLFERENQIKFHKKLFQITDIDWKQYSNNNDKLTIYEYYVNLQEKEEVDIDFEPDWVEWKAPIWQYPTLFKFSECLIPTRDSVRAEYLLRTMCTDNNYPTLVLGSSGTGKTSTIFQFFGNLIGGNTGNNNITQKSINFSSATTCGMFQLNIEADIEKRQGKTFAPPFGRRMIVFLDDISMPEVNTWGDQPTLEIVRQLIEYHGFYFLEKDKRGDRKTIELLDYVAAMSHPGGGRNDIPNRLKRHFYVFNITPPSNVSIDNIYGQMLRGRYCENKQLTDNIIPIITMSTIKLWLKVKNKMLPTPSKFHYIFNLFDLSRVFQGVLLPPTDIINNKKQLIDLWIHECERVFCDKLVCLEDQNWYKQTMKELILTEFGQEISNQHQEFVYWADFFREDIIDQETEEIAEFAPKIYESAASFTKCRERVEMFLSKYNSEPKLKEMTLVLFTDAVQHLMRICRILAMPRGNLLFVGVGGSGRQSLTKLASYICRYELCQIQLTRNYKTTDLLEDIKKMCILCGKDGKKVTFLVTDSDIVDEDFLEYINMMLATGMIAGLFPKEERDMMAAEIRPIAKKELLDFDDTHDTLVKFLMNRIRENFHIVLAFSPANTKFAERARKFPALISGCTIDWFLRWPVDALMSVSRKFIADDNKFIIQCKRGEAEKLSLIKYIGRIHDIIVNCCSEYFNQYRRHVYVTPKSYLSFINMYKSLYTRKREEIDIKSRNVNLGLSKIAKASQDVNNMKAVLAVQREELVVAEANTQSMLGKLEIGAKEAEIQKQEASKIEDECQETANIINKEKAEANEELQAALPFMEQAKKAAKSLNKKDIGFVASLPKPHDLIKRIMDCVSIILIKPLVRIENTQIIVNKEPQQFIRDSYSEYSLKMMSSAQFIPTLLNFSETKKDEINEETMELLQPYLECDDFTPESAKKIANAASGLCGFVNAMFNYHKASLIVAPRLAALQIKESELADAMDKLSAAKSASAAAQSKVDELERSFSDTMLEKKRIEDTAKATADKMIAATNLINSLGGERDRWTEDEKHFKDEKIRLIGDAAMACAFVSYCGPFNQQYRRKILSEYFYTECISDEFNISVTNNLNVNKFLCDDSQIAEWNSQTLPKDELSVQNGILVTSATRWPLIIDPQGQAAQWLKHRELANFPYFGTSSISEHKLRDQLKYAMQEGKTLIIEGVEEELDPMLDPVLEKNLFKQGKTWYVKLGDEDCEFDNKFKMYFITKLSNPHFTPELSAKTTVVDFAVTQKGLEDQLLSVVINQEQRSLEEQRIKLIEEVNNNTISLLNLDAQLLQKLSETEGDLLQDIELINVLNETKKSALEVKTKIESSKQTETMINKKREQYRSVATRGSILYFVMVDMALVNWMYQTSLSQFLIWFDYSLKTSKTANLVNQRVNNIIQFMTYHIYDNVNRGLFGDDKLTFKLMCSLRICETEQKILNNQEIQTFLKCGSSLSLDKIKIKKPTDWINPTMWTNIIALSKNIDFFRDLPSAFINNEKLWKLYYEDEQPENLDIPILQERINQINKEKASFFKMLLIRAIRDDRMTLVSKEFVSAIMGPKYIQPLTVTMDEVEECSNCSTPIILMLTPGADPTQTLRDLSRNKTVSINIVSMGEGQEPHATKAIIDGMTKGDWALLQNCHLGLKYMSSLPDNLKKWQEEIGIDKVIGTFRLWITCEAHPSFPIALLQMSVKVTQEAPQGMKAGLLRSYTTVVNRDRLQRVDKQSWRDLVFCLCFLHSVVQERRKFGSLGWNIPYEFNESDLDASLMFLEKHMFTITDISWSTVQYMICEAQYGGRITDDFDRILFNTYGTSWLGEHCFDSESFEFCQLKGGFRYNIPESGELVDDYQDYINKFPMDDSPEIFGLHTNADLTYGSATAQRILNTILDTQPKESSSSTGKTREEIVREICCELLSKMKHCKYIEEEVRDKIKKRPKHELEYVLQEKNQNILKNINGFEIPLNVFLYQEIIRLQLTIKNVRRTLSDLILAIDGVVIMTPNLQIALNSIFDAKPPSFWYIDASGAQIAWSLPTLSLWFDGLLRREEQLTSWLLSGRPNVYWMTGFFNPQGFLTAMKQEVTRRHKHDRWALDDVILKTTILDEYDYKKIKTQTDDGGVYIYGLYLDGCSYDTKLKILTQSKPKELYTKLPIIHVTAITNKINEAEKLKSKYKLYQCPVYTVPKRTDLNYVFVMNIPTKQNPNHWTLRGVAVLCSKD